MKLFRASRVAAATVLVASAAYASRAGAQTTLEPDRLFLSGLRAVSGLRMLEDRALDLEYPTSGTFSLIGGQSTGVDIPGMPGAKLSRTGLQVGWGWAFLKIGLFVDGLTLGTSGDFFIGGLRFGSRLQAGDYAVGSGLVPAISVILDEETSLTVAGQFNFINVNQRDGEPPPVQISPLARLRLFGFELQAGFPKEQDGLRVGAILGSLEVFKLLARFQSSRTEGPFSDALAVVGNLETLVQFYARNSNPYILDLANENVAETDVGLEYAAPPTWPVHGAARVLFAATGDPGFRRAEIELSYDLALFHHRLFGSMVSPYYLANMIPGAFLFGLFGGVWTPGVSLLGLNARAFTLRLDDGFHFGFALGVRIEMFTNLARLQSSEDYLARTFEGADEFAHVRAYWELRVSRNDMFSTTGLPFPDATAVGIYYVAEVLSNPPLADYRGYREVRRLNGFLDEDDAFRPYEVPDRYSPEAKSKKP